MTTNVTFFLMLINEDTVELSSPSSSSSFDSFSLGLDDTILEGIDDIVGFELGVEDAVFVGSDDGNVDGSKVGLKEGSVDGCDEGTNEG